MKAKVKATGEIIDGDRLPCMPCLFYGDGHIYSEAELDFNFSTPEEVTIEGYVARDQFDHNNLNLHPEKPYRDGNDINEYEDEGFWDNDKEKYFPLPDEMFPELTWWSEPKRVKITITPME